MNVLVCFKVVPDLDLLSGSDWLVDANLRIDTGFVPTMINPYDESALEMALKLSDYAKTLNVPVSLNALTLGDEKANVFIKKLAALRFATTVRIAAGDGLSFLPEITAYVISRYVQEVYHQDVLLFGRHGGVGDNEKTPLLVAEMLGWPCITQVIRIETKSEDCLIVASTVDGGIVKQSIKTPCVLSVGNVPNAYLRVPTLNDQIRYGNKPLQIIELQEFKLAAFQARYGTDAELIGLAAVSSNQQSLVIEGGSPAEKARILYDSFLRERLEKL